MMIRPILARIHATGSTHHGQQREEQCAHAIEPQMQRLAAQRESAPPFPIRSPSSTISAALSPATVPVSGQGQPSPRQPRSLTTTPAARVTNGEQQQAALASWLHLRLGSRPPTRHPPRQPPERFLHPSRSCTTSSRSGPRARSAAEPPEQIEVRARRRRDEEKQPRDRHAIRSRFSRGSASRRSSSASVPESRPSVMRALGCGSAKPPPIGANVTPPLARRRWPSIDERAASRRAGRPRCARTRRSLPRPATSRQMPPARSSGPSRKPVASADVSGARKPACAASPRVAAQLRHLGAIEQQPARDPACAADLRRGSSLPRLFSETPNDSAIWMRFKIHGCQSVRRDNASWSASQQRPRLRQVAAGRSKDKAGRTAPARVASAVPHWRAA